VPGIALILMTFFMLRVIEASLASAAHVRIARAALIVHWLTGGQDGRGGGGRHPRVCLHAKWPEARADTARPSSSWTGRRAGR
jgi:hypothetical protein